MFILIFIPIYLASMLLHLLDAKFNFISGPEPSMNLWAFGFSVYWAELCLKNRKTKRLQNIWLSILGRGIGASLIAFLLSINLNEIAKFVGFETSIKPAGASARILLIAFYLIVSLAVSFALANSTKDNPPMQNLEKN